MNHLFPYIERTLLHPDVAINEQYEALDEVNQLGLAGLTVAPFWVKKCRRELGDTHPATLATVVGFPYGYQRTETKQTEIDWALKDGANHIEVVLNASALFSPASVWIKIEWAKLVAMAHAQDMPFTAILETALLDNDLLVKMIKTAADAGVDYLKSSTGSLKADFSLETALEFRQLVPRSVGVKIVADGATEAEMEALVSAGVERLCLGHHIQSMA